MKDRLRVLAITTLFPSRADPGHAPFNRQQFAHLGRLVDLEVLALVPWRFGRPLSRARSRDIARHEYIDRLEVFHPRFITVPGLSGLNAGLMGASLVPSVLWRAVQRKRYDVILGAYAYPDAAAAVLVAEATRRPVVVKCHGSDLNRVPEQRAARLQLRLLLPRADRVVVVSHELGKRAAALGAPPNRVEVVYNGIDRARFFLRDAREARRALGLPEDRPIVLYVGTLAAHKGARDLLDAAHAVTKMRPEVTFVFVGDGPMQAEVKRAQAELGPGLVAAGRKTHAEVADYMAACTLLCLPSWDEGMPNVVREAHASGRPVVATSVGGIPEAVHDPVLGRLVPPRDPARLAEALLAQLDGPGPEPARVAQRAEVPTWAQSAVRLRDVLVRAAESH